MRPPASEKPSGSRRSVADSPWFWAYVFATGAMIALLVGMPKYAKRQEQIERQFLARQRAGQVVVRPEEPIDRPAGGGNIIGLWPLGLLLTFVLCVAWMVFWYQQRKSMTNFTEHSTGDSQNEDTLDENVP